MGSRVAALRDPITLAVGALAVHRLTRLVVEDTIADPIRDRLIERAPNGRVAVFVTCPWCVSVWAAVGWAALTVAAPRVAATAGAVLAWSSVTGIVASVVE
jgi:hypothetical protein